MAGNGAIALAESASAGTTSSTTAFNFSGAAMTVELWVKAWVAHGADWCIGCSNGTTTGWGVRTDNTSHLQFVYSNGTSLAVGPACPALINQGDWHHYAFVKSSTGIVCYMDGAQVASSSAGAGANLIPSNLALCIGARQSNTTPCNGLYSEVRVWSTARTAAEIAANWNRRLTTSQTGLVACWPISEDVGTSSTEIVSGNNATWVNHFWTTPPSPFTTGSTGGGGTAATNDDLAAWLSASDGTHLDSAPIRMDSKFDQDGVTIDTKLGNLATQLTIGLGGISTQVAIINGNTNPSTGGSGPAVSSDEHSAIMAQLAGRSDLNTIYHTLQELCFRTPFQAAIDTQNGMNNGVENFFECFPWIVEQVDGHTDEALVAISDQLAALQGAIAGYFADTDALITATGAQTTADTVVGVNEHTDAGLVILQGDMNDHELAVNEHTTFEADRLAALIDAEGNAAHDELAAAVDAINAHTTDVGTAVSAVTVAEAVLITQAVNNVTPDVNAHTTEEADRIIAALPTSGGGGGGADTAAINAHTTAEADRVIGNNNAQTTILIAVQTALAAVTLTVNTILEKVQDMVDQLTNVTGMVAQILAWINGQPSGGGTPTLVGSTTFSDTTYWPQPADYYEIEITAATGQTFMRNIPGGQHFRALGWTAQRVGGKYVFGEPLAFSSQRVNAGAILPDGLLINVKPGCTGTVTAYSYQ